MANKPRVYIDSCSYIDVAKGRTKAAWKTGEEDRAQQLWFIETLLVAALNGDVEIYGSTLILVECLFTETREAIPEETKELFKNLLSAGNPVRQVAVDPFIAERARDLLWRDGIMCGGSADQVHVATALELHCEEFITTNRKKGPLQPSVASQLVKHGLRVILPDQTQFIPEAYKKPILEAAGDSIRISASTVPTPPVSQSPGDEQAKEPEPAPLRRAIRLGGPEPPPPDSSPTDAPPPRSKR